MYLKEIDYSLRNETLIDKLTIIWQKSVEATHLFLSPQDIKDILPQVVIGLKQIPILLVSLQMMMSLSVLLELLTIN